MVLDDNEVELGDWKVGVKAEVEIEARVGAEVFREDIVELTSVEVLISVVLASVLEGLKSVVTAGVVEELVSVDAAGGVMGNICLG